MKHPCPCCRCLTICDYGSYEICPVCFWEDDPAQGNDPEMPRGANNVSLKQARMNYESFGACSKDEQQLCRPPEPSEVNEGVEKITLAQYLAFARDELDLFEKRFTRLSEHDPKTWPATACIYDWRDAQASVMEGDDAEFEAEFTSRTEEPTRYR